MAPIKELDMELDGASRNEASFRAGPTAKPAVILALTLPVPKHYKIVRILNKKHIKLTTNCINTVIRVNNVDH